MNYKVYQGTELKQTVASKRAVMNGLQPNQTYEFGVEPDATQTVGGRTRYTHIAYANITHVAIENDSFTLSERATVRFGAGNTWVYKTFDAGSYGATNDTFGRDPCVGVVKSAEVVSDFSVGQGSNKTYIGFYIDFTQADSTDPSQYTWNPKATTSVTTRGIRFNIPKTLTVGSTITLRYEEYPLGIVPIGNEPSGYFGGGNKQNLSAKVISTENGSSIVEVAGNVIEVGGANLASGDDQQYIMGYGIPNTTWENGYAYEKLPTNIIYNEILPQKPYSFHYTLNQGTTYTQTIWFETDATVKDLSAAQITWFTYSDSGHDVQPAKIQKLGQNSYKLVSTYTWPGKRDNSVRLFDIENLDSAFDLNTGTYFKFGKLKLEPGTIATPYAAFVDGDTFTAQPDGTLALFSEHKALYY